MRALFQSVISRRFTWKSLLIKRPFLWVMIWSAYELFSGDLGPVRSITQVTQWPGDRSKGVAQLAQSTCIVFLDHVQNLHISCSARQNPYEFFLHEYVNFVHGPEKQYSSVSTKIYIFMQCAPKSFCRFSVWGMILNHPFKGWFRCQLCDPCIGPLRIVIL